MRMTYLIKITGLVASLGLSANAWSYTIDVSTEVGGVDAIIAAAEQGNDPILVDSGDAAEEAWVESILGMDITLDKLTNSSGGYWTATNESPDDVFAFDLGAFDGDYYVVKLGNLCPASAPASCNPLTHFLYDNAVELQYAVISLKDILTTANVDTSTTSYTIDIDKVSHLSGISGGDTPCCTRVPEPGSLALFALGAFGLRRMTKL